jgi:hypothetical protein
MDEFVQASLRTRRCRVSLPCHQSLHAHTLAQTRHRDLQLDGDFSAEACCVSGSASSSLAPGGSVGRCLCRRLSLSVNFQARGDPTLQLCMPAMFNFPTQLLNLLVYLAFEHVDARLPAEIACSVVLVNDWQLLRASCCTKHVQSDRTHKSPLRGYSNGTAALLHH